MKLIMSLVLTLVFSSAVFADSYNCSIPKDTVNSDFTSDVEFSVQMTDQPSISMFDEAISDNCRYEGSDRVLCKDAEGMPYIAEFVNETTFLFTVGFYINKAYADCVKN